MNEKIDLRWRFDFDKSFKNVSRVNKNDIEHFKDIKHFIKHLKWCINNIEKFELLKDCEYIDYVNIGCKNLDNKTYSFKQYWETSNKEIIFDCEGNDAPLTEDGKFAFSDDVFPCVTRIIENGVIVYDYRINKK